MVCGQRPLSTIAISEVEDSKITMVRPEKVNGTRQLRGGERTPDDGSMKTMSPPKASHVGNYLWSSFQHHMP